MKTKCEPTRVFMKFLKDQRMQNDPYWLRRVKEKAKREKHLKKTRK